MNTPNKNDNTAVVIFILLFCACCCCCCVSSLSISVFLLSGKKDDEPSPSNIPPPPVKISAGTSVKCSANELRGREGSVYRSMEDGTLAWYPNPEIASSWNPNWSKGILDVDCKGFTKGEDVKMKSYFTEGVDYTIKGSRENPTRYCSNAPDTGMICDRTILGGWEKFQFKHVDGNVYGIKSNRTGKYCKDNKTGNMSCNHGLNAHEKLTIKKHGDKYSIKGPWGNKYCSDQPVGLVCNTDPLQDWEKFTITKA